MQQSITQPTTNREKKRCLNRQHPFSVLVHHVLTGKAEPSYYSLIDAPCLTVVIYPAIHCLSSGQSRSQPTQPWTSMQNTEAPK